ncbi:MAG: hypothetical protein Crog4KO_31390 [Crocinitomicaceae bacterium]
MELLHNIKELTNFHLDLSSISVLGTKLGDHKGSLTKDLIIEENNQVWFRSQKGIAIRFSIEAPNRIIEYQFLPETLAALEMKQKKHVQLCFGPADAIEIKGEVSFYFYEIQQIVVAWDNENDCLLSVHLGENRIQQTRYSIKDFLALFREFKAMVPDSSNWQLNQLKSNESGYYRLKQLLSLMKAFNLGSDLLSDVHRRGFLKHRTEADFAPLISDMKSYLVRSKKGIQCSNTEFKNMPYAFYDRLLHHFFQFSEEMRNLIRINDDWLEADSVTSHYSIFKTEEVLKSIDLKALEEIENLLHKIMDPHQQVFSKSMLIEQFDFPDVDLEQIDMKHF